MSGFDKAKAEELLAADQYSGSLGIELISVSSDELVLALDVTDQHTNFLGLGHGGMVFSLADCALSLAGNSTGNTSLAIDAHIVLTAPSRPGDRLVAHVTEVSRSRRLATYSVSVTRSEGKTVATLTGTVYITEG